MMQRIGRWWARRSRPCGVWVSSESAPCRVPNNHATGHTGSPTTWEWWWGFLLTGRNG
jgi:hypothetical protein